MKHVIFITFFAVVFSFGAFASSPSVKEQKTVESVEKATATNEEAGSVHIEGTMTSSCGATWSFTYDCYSGCSFSGTISHLADLQRAINNACGTSTTEINLSW